MLRFLYLVSFLLLGFIFSVKAQDSTEAEDSTITTTNTESAIVEKVEQKVPDTISALAVVKDSLGASSSTLAPVVTPSPTDSVVPLVKVPDSLAIHISNTIKAADMSEYLT